MPATTARGTDAERTEYAAPVAVENVEVDATGLLVVADRDVGLEVVLEEAVLVLFPVAVVTTALVTGTSDTESEPLVRSVGTVGGDTVPVPGITVGNDSVTPEPSVAPTSLHMKSLENHWNSTVNSRGLRCVRGRILRQRYGSDSDGKQSEELNFHYEVLECRVKEEKSEFLCCF